MTYFPVNPIGNSRGINYDQFDNAVLNPMIPQDSYRPDAMGPKYLSTDGLGWTSNVPQVRRPVSGLGIAPVRPELGQFGTAALLVLGVLVVGMAVHFMGTGAETTRAGAW